MKSTATNLKILFEDNHIIVVNKRAGDLVQGDKTGDLPLSDLLKEYLKIKYNKPGNVYLGVVHRLDRPTTGIVLFAKTSKALERLNKMLRDKTIDKTYWAIVKNKPVQASSTLTNYLQKNPKNNKARVFQQEGKDRKKAILQYKTVKNLDNYYLLEIDLETGRHHQIRAQLAHINCPIKGDLKYGFNRSNKNAGIHLHARKIEFTHPVSKDWISIEAPTPKDPIWDACHSES
jgi:23S rRNA pseudouridine1911/1915/1917 synthase